MTLPINPSGQSRGSSPKSSEPGRGNEVAARDTGSFRIATVSGIPIRLHFTFLLLILAIAYFGGARTAFFLLGLFFCVVLHELGHSLVAQRYGYKVRDIVLYPIGGVASLEGCPRPRHELWIALAGPAVNVVIAALLAVYLGTTGTFPAFDQLLSSQALSGGDATALLRANILLVLFNMIPAFPMDGGRVLRALLALSIGRGRATRIAAFIGQAIAILFGIYGLRSGQIGLVLIALFVFFGAGQEAAGEQSREVVEGAAVGAAMVREFQTLGVGDSLRRAAEVLLATHQQDFPVVHGDEIVGVLPRGALLRGLAERGESAYVSEVMLRDVLRAKPDDSLEEMLTRPEGVQRAPVLVMENDHLVGMLTADNLMEFLTLRQIAQAREQSRNGR